MHPFDGPMQCSTGAFGSTQKSARALLITFLCALATPAFAQNSATTNRTLQLKNDELVAVDGLLTTRGSITLRSMTLQDALFTISETWQVNLLFAEEVTGSVNGSYRDVTLRELLDSILLANGYGYRTKGQSLIIMKLDQLGDTNAMLKTETISLPPDQAGDIVEAATMFLSPQGKLQNVPSLNSMMLRDYPENIARLREFVDSVKSYRGTSSDAPSGASSGTSILTPVPVPLLGTSTGSEGRSVVYFTPRHTKAADLRETFEALLGTTAKVVVVETENRLAIIDSAAGIRLAHQIFAELDVPRQQVQITALIYDVSVEELENLGVNWTHNAKAGLNGANIPRHSLGGKFGPITDPTAGAFTIGNALDAALDVAGYTATSTANTGAAGFTTLNRYLDVNAVLSALETTEGARLLADPTVMVLDREEATIRIVTEVPIQQLTQTSQGGSIGTTSFREAGVTLRVTPQIGGDGTITMQVSPTFSVLSGFNEGQPIIDSREATTVVRVTDGNTIVIGGLRQRSEVETVSGVPGLMKWRYVGKLFRSHSTSVRESELMVFLKPVITNTDHNGSARQMAGLCAAHRALERLNWPGDFTHIPQCHDPNCPNHNPRMRYVNPNPSYELAMPAQQYEALPQPTELNSGESNQNQFQQPEQQREYDSFDQMMDDTLPPETYEPPSIFPDPNPPNPNPAPQRFDRIDLTGFRSHEGKGKVQLLGAEISRPKQKQRSHSGLLSDDGRFVEWPTWLQ